VNHPVFHNVKSAITYLGMWVLIMGIHFFIFYFQYGFPFIISVTDSFLNNGIFSILGIPVWYVVRYSVPSRKTRFNLLFNHLTSLALIIVIWVSASYSILNSLFGTFTFYRTFLSSSIPYRIISGIFFYILLCLAYYLVMYNTNLQEKLKEEARLNELLKESELNMLRSQINPHFLFNSLNSISSLTISNPEKAREMLIKLSDFLRYSVSTSTTGFTSLEKEMTNIQRYLEIEKVRFGNKLEFGFKLDGDCKLHKIPAMLLQPLFENAIKHGVYESTEQVRIEMDCRFADDCLMIDLVNDFEPGPRSRKGAGVGLKNIRERLRLMYKSDTLMKTSVSGNKFHVSLCLPEIKSFENTI
jgi:two-component system, LytTR family, sensor kinase